MIVCIPAYEPDLRLPRLVRDLAEHLSENDRPAATVVIIDDGSGPAYDEVLRLAADAGAHLVRYRGNRGKGHALRAGFAWALANAPGESVVCADCDGQHTPRDIADVGAHVTEDTVVLGGRRFTGSVPLRSRVGNAVTRWVFRRLTGVTVHDTQTGLRGYPASLLPWLRSLPGDRFEYELTMLLRADQHGVTLVEIPIETVYHDANASSHFRPVRDSLRVCSPLLAFAASSVAGYLVDLVALLALMALTGQLAASVVGARLLSATVNYRLNRDLVFAHRGSRRASAVRYGALAVGLLAANLASMSVLVTLWGLPLIASKLAVEASLFVLSFGVQRGAVFRTPTRAVRRAPAVPEGPTQSPDATKGPREIPRALRRVQRTIGVTSR